MHKVIPLPALFSVSLLAAELSAASPQVPGINQVDPGAREKEIIRQEQRIHKRQQETQTEAIQTEKEQKSTDEKEQGQTFLLRSIRFNKSDYLNRKQLTAVIKPYLGQEISLGDLNHIIQQINALYQSLGVYTASAILPPQTIDKGMVLIRLVEGKLGDLVISKNQQLSEHYIAQWLEYPQDSKLVDIKLLEKDILRFNRVNDARLQAQLKAGKTFGLTDIIVSVAEPSPHQVQLFADNYGYKTSGQEEVGGFYRGNSLLTDSDRTLLYGLASSGSKALSINYNRPINASGWRVGGGLTYNQTEVIEGDFKNLSVEGQSYSAILNTSWLAYSTNNLWVDLIGSLAYTQSETDIQSQPLSDYDIQQLNMGAALTWLGDNWQLSANQELGYVSTNNKLLGNRERFTLLNGDATFLYRFEQAFFYGLILADWQYTSQKALAGAVSYSLGGATTIRGYEPGVISGDYGYMTNFELHYDGWELFNGVIDSFVFFDYGTVYSINPDQSPHSVGVGLTWGGPHNLSVSLTAAKAMEDIVPEQKNGMIYGRLSWDWN